jgi:hypothetical protein
MNEAEICLTSISREQPIEATNTELGLGVIVIQRRALQCPCMLISSNIA